MTRRRLVLTRAQILAYRRRVQALDERLATGRRSLRHAAWAGLQDSMPRAALLSLHARVDRIGPRVLDDPSLVQVWGPRFSAYVVAKRDVAVFTLGRHPDDERGRRASEDLAQRLRVHLRTRKMLHGDAGRGLALSHHNQLRYATTTGTVLIRWDGAHQPTLWSVPAPRSTPRAARLELARRYLHVFGPTTAEAFSRWAGIAPLQGRGAFEALERSMIPVRTPIGEAWILSADEATFRKPAGPSDSARFLPSGDTYFLLQGADRDLLVPEARQRGALWTSRVWPGAVLLRGEIVGTWRRAGAVLTVQSWRRLARTERALIESEAASLPLPDVARAQVRWEA